MHVPEVEVAINDRRLLLASVVAHPEGGVGHRQRVRRWLAEDPAGLAREPGVRAALAAGDVDRAEETTPDEIVGMITGANLTPCNGVQPA